MMKKKFLCVTVLGLLAIITFAQHKESTTLLSISFSPGFGNGKVYSTKLENLHGLYNGGNLLLYYHINQHLSIAAGAGILTFNANHMIDGNPASTELDFLQIPVKVIYIGGTSIVQFKIGVTGFYNTHRRSVTDMSHNQRLKESNLGGNYGVAADIGPMFQITKRWRASASLEHQFTISKVTGTQIGIENYLVKFGIYYAIINK